MFDLLCLVGFGIIFGIVLIVVCVMWLLDEGGTKATPRPSPRGQYRFSPQSQYDFDELVDELMWEGYSRPEAEWEAEAGLEALGREHGLLPSGYTREEYRRYGATDFDIEFWGLDQPGAPPPDEAGWVVWGMADEMDW